MIREVSGDILLSSAQVIAQGVAPNDHFSNGLALSLREQWPAMVRDFRHYVRVERPKAGTIWAWPTPNGQRIVSLLTQEGEYSHGGTPGPAHLEYVRHALHALRDFVVREGVTSLALPRVATGVGGLRWDDVYPVLKAQLGELPIPVIVYATYHAGVKADEGIPPAGASTAPGSPAHHPTVH